MWNGIVPTVRNRKVQLSIPVESAIATLVVARHGERRSRGFHKRPIAISKKHVTVLEVELAITRSTGCVSDSRRQTKHAEASLLARSHWSKGDRIVQLREISALD